MATLLQEMLTPAQEKKIQPWIEDIDNRKTSMIENAIGIGESLEAWHEYFAVEGKGSAFYSIVERRCGFSKSTSLNYMNAHRVFGNCQTIAHFSDKAMYLLSSENTPEEAVKKAIGLTKKGQTIDVDKAKELIAEAERKLRPADEPINVKSQPTPEVAAPRSEPMASSSAIDEPEEDEVAFTGPDKEPAVATGPCDEIGQELTEQTEEAFALRAKFTEIDRSLTAIHKQIEALVESEAGAWIDITRIATDMRNIREVLKHGKPFALCAQCGGNTCSQCRKSGYVPKRVHETLSSAAGSAA